MATLDELANRISVLENRYSTLNSVVNGHASEEEDIAGSLSFLKGKEKELLQFLIRNYRGEFTPIEVSRELSVSNKTVINRLAVLVKNGFAVPAFANQRIRSYELSEFTKDHQKEIMKEIS